MGWELFLNYKITRDKCRPDFFLYENNKSMSPAIKQQITDELGVEPILINSALVSAQSRQRLYWVGKKNSDGSYSTVKIDQPTDKGIVLRDIFDDAFSQNEKGYAFSADYYKHLSEKETEYMLRNVKDGRNHFDFEYFQDGTRDKARCITANIHKGVPYNVLAEPVRIGTIESKAQNKDFDSQQYRVYSPDAKSVTLCGQGGGVGAKTGLYAAPTADNNTTYPIYKVKDSLITIKGEKYPIKLADGSYIIRKLTVSECKRLQTIPDSYVFPVSNSQAYKMIGNGWTCDVISHIMSYFDGISTEPVEVLSMYDGMSCGRIALQNLGANVERYFAYEIDKYAIKTTQYNYPDTIQCGDAFQVREDGWKIK